MKENKNYRMGFEIWFEPSRKCVIPFVRSTNIQLIHQEKKEGGSEI